VHLLVSEQYIDFIMHGTTIKVLDWFKACKGADFPANGLSAKWLGDENFTHNSRWWYFKYLHNTVYAKDGEETLPADVEVASEWVRNG